MKRQLHRSFTAFSRLALHLNRKAPVPESGGGAPHPRSVPALLAAHEAGWTALAAELEEFARKNDYRFAAEAVGEEGSSWRRVLDVFVGRPGVFGPERADEAATARAERPAPPQKRGNDG